MLKKSVLSLVVLSLTSCTFSGSGSVNTTSSENKNQVQDSKKDENKVNQEEPSKLKDLPVKEVQAIPDMLVITEGNKVKGTASVIYADNSRNSNLVWTSSDNTLATVNPSSGEISGVRAGIVTILATAQTDTSKRTSITVTIKRADVTEAITKIEPKEASIKVGETVRLNASIQMSDGSISPNVMWKTDNASVVTVSNGLVTGISEGTTTVTAIADGDSTKKASAKITVTK